MENLTPQQQAVYQTLIKDGISASEALSVAQRSNGGQVSSEIQQNGIWGVLRGVGQEIARTPLRLAENIRGAGVELGNLGRIATGREVQQYQPRFSEFLGEEVRPLQGIREGVGAGLELASYIPIASGVRTGVEAVRGASTVARAAGALVAEGALGGGLFEAGRQIQEGEFDPATIARNIVAGGVVGGALGVGGGLVAPTGRAIARTGARLRDLMPSGRALDVAIDVGEGVRRGLDTVQESITEGISNSIDRRILRIATETPDKAKENMFDLYRKGVVPGVKGKKKSLDTIEATREAVTERIVPKLSQKYEVTDLEDFARAISEEKKDIWRNIEAGLVEATERGAVVDTQKIVNELDALMATERASFNRGLRSAIQRARAEFVDEDGVIKTLTPEGAQDIIADLNSQLQSYFRGSTSGTNADVIVDTLILNNLRRNVDEVVEALDDSTFAQLKREYADLKMIENDVVYRAIHEAQRSSRLPDLTDIFSAGDVAAGLLEPAFLLKGVTQYVTKGVLKDLTSRDELIRRLFLYGRNLVGEPITP